MGPLGFGQRLLWAGFVGPDRCMIKAIGHVEIGSAPNPALAELIMSGLVDALFDFPRGTTAALLLTRPGVGPVSQLDRRWAGLLIETATKYEVSLEPIFRANDEALVQVEPELDETG